MEKEELEHKLSAVYQEPVKLWGPYKCQNGRMHVDLKLASSKKSKSHQYARVILEAKLGRRLGSEETVDHIDEDFTNDHPDNLQSLSLSENARKSANGAALVNWQSERKGTKELSELTAGERNALASLSNEEVKQMREGFVEFGGLKELAKGAPCNRKSLRAILEGRTYQNAGGPTVKFLEGSHDQFRIE